MLPFWALGLLGVIPATLTFHWMPDDLRVIPLVAIGVLALWRIISLPRPVLAVLGGVGIGFGNTEDPFGYLLLQSHQRRVGDNALFGGGLVALKGVMLWLLWDDVTLPPLWLLLLFGVISLPVTKAGQLFFGAWKDQKRRLFIHAWVPMALVFLMIGVFRDHF